MNIKMKFGLAALSLSLLAGCVVPAQPDYGYGPAAAVGPAPDCPYGYYDFAPYNCAPYGYYGPEWFAGGVFIGVGPWYRGPAHFRGYVDNRFDVRGGYRGPLPGRGERPVAHPGYRFQGNEYRDGRGHITH
ncbi:hypothetical protein [Dyella caseinilytica]|uniref:Lipoprotein n=1 Tax=Dyella caseinilytica TaxID=1849581 RepID=A0ABX7GVG5_9GAMM|nr:hypothetical protein [Dyella caseinilytica]QRN53859.1 hypothetical protein ISN74_00085 [Dyella caseinilytica]GFZ89669.1 hypothetical protein GCM10011408_05860 [Dyella caseinilytica]